MRTLKPAGKLEELTHERNRYRWNMLGLCKMRWKKFGKMFSDDRHKVYFRGEEGRYENRVGFPEHKDMVSAVLGCQQTNLNPLESSSFPCHHNAG